MPQDRETDMTHFPAPMPIDALPDARKRPATCEGCKTLKREEREKRAILSGLLGSDTVLSHEEIAAKVEKLFVAIRRESYSHERRAVHDGKHYVERRGR